jgi:spore germination cell wall hydrolase CwlJ-like protein
VSWDYQVAARTVWAEARGEPDNGERAVAHVLWNRLKDGRFGSTLAGVCTKPLQFSCWNHNDPQRIRMTTLEENGPELAPFLEHVRQAWLAPQNDPTNGALFYYSDSMTTPPSWAAKMTLLKKIGRHSFFTDKPNIS